MHSAAIIFTASPSVIDSEFLPWTSGRVPSGFWDVTEHRCRYMSWLGQQCGFRTEDDWYSIQKSDFRQHQGRGLLANYYDDSPSTAVQECYPDYPWKPWLFRAVPRGFWSEVEHRRAYMDWLGDRLGFVRASDWYFIDKRDFYNNAGGGLLSKYFGNSPLAALLDYKPHYRWKAWLLRRAPRGYWKQLDNPRHVMAWIQQKCSHLDTKARHRVTTVNS